MADEDCGTLAAGKGGVEPIEPGRKRRFVPVVLQYACGVTECKTPV